MGQLSIKCPKLLSALVAAWMSSVVPSKAACIGTMNTAIPHSTLASAFTVNADGTALARATGLMWARCLLGQTLVDGVCSGSAATMRWEDALAAARSARLAGYNDWRLPNPKEALSVIDDRCLGPSLNADIFPIAVPVFGIWTSSVMANLTGQYNGAWVVSSDGWSVSFGSESQVWLVRQAR